MSDPSPVSSQLSWHLTVPIDPAQTAHNQRLHWGTRAARNRASRDAARWAWIAAGSPVASRRIRVSVTLRRPRPLDPANVWDGLKPALDGLFTRAMTPDDSARWVELGAIRQERAEAPSVEFLVEELG